MPYGRARISVQLTGHAHFWHPTGEPVHAARHADDPPRGRAGPSKSRPDHIVPRIRGRPMPRMALCGLSLAPGMAPIGRSRSSNYFFKLEPRYGIEP